MRVFISSTSIDLRDYREAAIKTCNRLGLVPIAMEFFGSIDVGATEGSKRQLDEADVYVGVFAYRYGYIEKGYTASVTEIEFDYAGERGLKRLCFIADPKIPWLPASIEYDQMERLNKLKYEKVSSLIRSEFTTVDDFATKLMHSLVNWMKQFTGQTVHPQANVKVLSTVMTLPPIPSLLVGRDDDLNTIKSHLGIKGGERSNVTILHGWPGVGKTTLLAAIAYDTEINKAFPDGVLWGSVGEKPNPFATMTQWIQTLDDDDFTQVRSVEEAQARLRKLLYNKKVLLIIDDVWEIEHAAVYSFAGKQCSILVTTRSLEIARELAPTSAEILRLGILKPDKAFDLIRQLAPKVADRHRAQVEVLLEDLQGLPLTIQTVGRLLEREIENDPGSVDALFAELREGGRVLELRGPVDRFDPQTGTIPSVAMILSKSVNRLDEETQMRFALLGLFVPKPASFDLKSMADLWNVADPKPTAWLLADRGLFEPINGTERFLMHAAYVTYARQLLREEIKLEPPPPKSAPGFTQITVEPEQGISTVSSDAVELTRLYSLLKMLQRRAERGQAVHADIQHVTEQIQRLENPTALSPQAPLALPPAPAKSARPDSPELALARKRLEMLHTRQKNGQNVKAEIANLLKQIATLEAQNENNR